MLCPLIGGLALVQETIDTFGKIDILVNNVGGHGKAHWARTKMGFINITEEEWDENYKLTLNRDEMARVARSTSIPIATGERLATKYEFRELLEKQVAAILLMDIGRVGGILEAKKIAGIAETYYAQIAPHGWCGPIQGAANI